MGHSGSIILFIIICALLVFLFARLRRSFRRTTRMLNQHDPDPADPLDHQHRSDQHRFDQHGGGSGGGHGHDHGGGAGGGHGGFSGGGGGHHG